MSNCHHSGSCDNFLTQKILSRFLFLCNCHSLTILLFFSYRFEGNKGLVSVRLTLLLKLWQIEPRTYIYLQRALESDFVPLNERNKLNYLIAKVNHIFFVYTLFMFIYSRHHSRFFDCLAHPNLSATLATDQK